MTKREWVIIAAVMIIGGSVVGGLAYKNKNTDSTASMDSNKMAMTDSSSNYTVNLMSGKSYPSNKPVSLHFTVEKNGKAFKGFVLDSTKLVHLIVVRKDRSNFQHVHPTYNSKTGMFTMDNFQFPTDGQYRIYANFATTSAHKDAMGMIATEAPYVDVNVGDASKVAAQPLGADSQTSTADGLTAMIVSSPNNSSTPTFYAGQDGTVEIGITKDGAAFKNLQEYLGNLGHMVILGPNLEFIHAHPISGDVNNQTGYIPFMVTFPISGQYKIYLQTKVNDAVSTFDFNVTVKNTSKAGSSSNSNNSMQGMDMQMSH
jgi:hypothetical protein